MKIAVYGAGAIGGHLAARLAHQGADVAVIARGEQLAGIRARGLTVRAPEGEFSVPVKAAATPAEIGAVDAVLVTVKAPALAAIAAGIAPLLGPATRVVFVQNGIPWWYLNGAAIPHADPGDAVRRAVGLERCIGGVVYSACTVVEPGVIEVTNTRSRLILGMPDGSEPADLKAIAAALDQQYYSCEVTPRIRDAVWTKLFGNLAIGPFAVLGGAAPRTVFGDPVIRDASRTILAEGLAVAQALGCTPVYEPDRVLKGAQTMVHRPSILQDLQLGRPMEIDGIYSTTLSLAESAGVPTPMLSLMVALMKVRARAAGLYAGNAV